MRIAFTTLGCKINQYETDQLRKDLETRGDNTIVPFGSKADVYIINTCSVTAKSDYQCRQAIRSAVRRARGAKVVVTGCYASTRPEELEKIAGVDLVVPNTAKSSLVDRIIESSASRGGAPTSAPAKAAAGRTRGFLKIQDGCDNRCSYCIIPIARGTSRSVEPSDVIGEFSRLIEAGCPEVVLTGIHIGMYGNDLAPGTSLTGLIRTLLSKRGQARVRLSSIEPNEITDELISFLGHGLCRHLHIPLQSGDDSILSSMRRQYSSGFYRGLVEKIAEKVPEVALGADVIVGFPGEGDREFQRTFDLIEKSPLTHLHVFAFSRRPGTPAAEMNVQVPDSVKKTRSEELRKLALKKNLDFRKKILHSVQKVVIEDCLKTDRFVLSGLSDNYIKVTVSDTKKELIGREISVRINEVEKDVVLASIL